MRITNNITNNIALQSQLRSSQKLNDATQVASTGERVNAPSDDPVAWSAAVSHDARIKRMERRTQTGERAAGDFDLAENALASAGDIMSQVQAIAVQASNDPPHGGAARGPGAAGLGAPRSDPRARKLARRKRLPLRRNAHRHRTLRPHGRLSGQ